MFIRAGRPRRDRSLSIKIRNRWSVQLVDGKDLTISHGLLVAEAIRAQEALVPKASPARESTCIRLNHSTASDRARVRRNRRNRSGGEHWWLTAGSPGTQVVSEDKPCPMEYVGIQERMRIGTPED